MRGYRSILFLGLIFGGTLVFAERETVAFFGFAPGEDPMMAKYFTDRVYWALSTDTLINPVSPERWKSLEGDFSIPAEAWKLEQYRGIAKKTGARYFVLAFQEPFRYATHRVWWKPWGLSVRTFQPVRLKIYGTENDSMLYDGVMAHEDSLQRISPWPYAQVEPRDPRAFDQWQHQAYASLVGPTVNGIRAAITGKPLPSAVFIERPPKAKKEKKKK